MKRWSSYYSGFLLFVILLTGCTSKTAITNGVDLSGISSKTEDTGGTDSQTAGKSVGSEPDSTGMSPDMDSNATSAPDTNILTSVPVSNLKEKAVEIQLDHDPRVRAPISTLLSPETKLFRFYFTEDMNRHSVEKAIKENMVETMGDFGKVQVQFTWLDNRQLRLRVDVSLNPQGWASLYTYKLDVNGARTADDRELENQPIFQVYLQNPDQIWRISTDGQIIEQVSDFKEPYQLRLLEDNPRYALITQTTGYCECDMMVPRIYSLYDLQEQRFIPYPIELQENYRGPGDFIVDTRGFFYSREEASEAEVPECDTTRRIQIDGFVHGANLSRDRRYVFMAVGKREQESNLDLLIYDLLHQTMRRFPGALLGTIPRDTISNDRIPVYFHDDGKGVYVYLIDQEPHEMMASPRDKIVGYVYQWDSGTLEKWIPPEGSDLPSRFNHSSDAVYKIYPSSDLYKNGEKIAQVPDSNGIWLNGTHTYIFEMKTEPGKNAARSSCLLSYDADRGVTDVLLSGLPDISLLGSSEDGRWIYVMSAQKIERTPE